MSSPSPNVSSVATAKEKDGKEKEVSGDETFDQVVVQEDTDLLNYLETWLWGHLIVPFAYKKAIQYYYLVTMHLIGYCVKKNKPMMRVKFSYLYFIFGLQFDDEDDLQYGATASGRKRLFSKELRCMMFGFGDDQNPYTESVDLLEDLVIEYITDMVRYVFIIKVVINSKTMKNNLDFKLEMLRRTSN